jgi:predicted transcriptional regulator of viral defense system
MRFEELVTIAADLHCFSPGMVTAGVDIDSIRVQLSRWVSSGRLIRIHKGWYTLNEPFRRIRLDRNIIACTIKRAAYVSLQAALAYHGMIPEYVAETTCVTTGRPLSIDTPIGRLAYHHIKKELFFGYRQEDGNTQHSYIASPEKALLDLFYFTPGSRDTSYIAELRLQNFDALDPEKLAAMAEHTRLPGIRRTIQLLLEYMK